MQFDKTKQCNPPIYARLCYVFGQIKADNDNNNIRDTTTKYKKLEKHTKSSDKIFVHLAVIF